MCIILHICICRHVDSDDPTHRSWGYPGPSPSDSFKTYLTGKHYQRQIREIVPIPKQLGQTKILIAEEDSEEQDDA